MRYVAKTLSDRIFHLADEPHVRSYCGKLRGKLVVDLDTERVADRTVKVCAACRTVLDDRRAAERAMNDNFMITDVEKRPRPRPAVEPALFDLGDDQALPVVDAAAVIAAGVPVVDATPTGEESSHLSGARQKAAAYRVLGTTDEVTTCEQCGRDDLKRTVMLVPLDVDGNPECDPSYLGTSCAAQAAGWTVREVAERVKEVKAAARAAARDAAAASRAAVMRAYRAETDAFYQWLAATYPGGSPVKKYGMAALWAQFRAMRVTAADVTTQADPADVWEGEGGAVPGVTVPAAAETGTVCRDAEDGGAPERPACDETIRYVVPVLATALRGRSLEGVCTCGGTHWAAAVDEPRPGRRAAACDRIVKRWGYERTEDWGSAGHRVAVRPITDGHGDGAAAAAVVTETRDQADDANAPVAVFIVSKNSTPARLRVLWWMSRTAAVRLCSDSRTSWTSSALHWTARVDPDGRGVDWEFVPDRRPDETAVLFAELCIAPLSWEELQERKPGTCHPERWCNHAWPCGRDLEAWRAKQPKSKSQLRRERQEAARAANTAPAEQQQPASDAHEHAPNWIEMRADLGCGATTYHAVCECGQEVGAWTGRQPGISTGTLRKPLTIWDAPTSTGDAFADRSGFDRTGRWEVVSESVKRARIELRDEEDRPGFTPTCGELCGHSVICSPRPATPTAPAPPAAADAEPDPAAAAGAESQPTAGPRGQVTVCGAGTTWCLSVPPRRAAARETPQAPAPAALAAAPVRLALTAAPAAAELDYRVRAALVEAADHPSGKAPERTNAWALQELLDLGWFTARCGVGSITQAGRRAAAALPRQRVVIVPCGGKKQDAKEVCPAGDMYVGSYHQACRRAADALAGEDGLVLILSAKYGLTRLSHYIARYDLRAGDPGTIADEQLREQAHQLYITGAHVTALGGAEYVRLAREVWPDAETPLSGCRGIGEQLARLASIYNEGPAPTTGQQPATVDGPVAPAAADVAGRHGKPRDRDGAAPQLTAPAPVDVWEGEGGAALGVDTPAPATAATAPMPIDWAKPAGRGDCAAANTCHGFGVLLWDVPGCAPRCTECAAQIMGHTPAALRTLTLPGDVAETEEQAEAADIVIRHTHEDGTTVEGSSKGDGVWEALRPLGWAYRRTPGIFIRGSRYKGADRWKIDRAADAVRALGMSCAVVIEENMSFAEREAARVETAEDRAVRFADRAGRAAASSQAARDTSDRIGERFWMGQPILIGHHSEGRARRDQERMHNAMRKSIAESERAGYWADRAAASEAYERYRKNPGRTLRRIEELEAERRGVLRERDGVDDKGRQADVWRREPSTARRGELTRRLAEYDEELTYWAETIKEAERRGFKVWGRADFVKGDFAWWRGTWYEVTRVNAKTVTVPHIHAAFDGGAVGAVDGCRVVTRAATQETRHQGSTYTLPYNEVSRRMSAEQMRAALAGETIPADPRDATPEPAHEGAEAEQTAELQDQADPAPVDSGLVHSSESEFSRERPEAPRAASAALTVADVGTGPADVAAGERTTTLPITDKKLPVARADLGGAKPLPATGVEALTAAGVPMVGGCCSCGAAIERPLNGPRPACTHEGATHPDGSVVVGGYRVTPKGHGRCLTDHHDIEGVALYEARNTVARCGGCVAADLGVDPSALPAIPEFSNMSGAQQTPKSAAAATRADTIPADIRAMEEEWRRRSPNPAGGILRVPLAETRPAEPAGPAAPEADLTLF